MDKTAVEPQQRPFICPKPVDVALRDVSSHRQPGITARKAARMTSIPAHRTALRVTVQPIAADQFLKRILNMLRWNEHLFHADLIPCKEQRSSPDRQRQHGQNTGLRLSDLTGDPALVMTANHPIGPGVLRDRVHVRIDMSLK